MERLFLQLTFGKLICGGTALLDMSRQVDLRWHSIFGHEPLHTNYTLPINTEHPLVHIIYI